MKSLADIAAEIEAVILDVEVTTLSDAETAARLSEIVESLRRMIKENGNVAS